LFTKDISIDLSIWHYLGKKLLRSRSLYFLAYGCKEYLSIWVRKLPLTDYQNVKG